LRLNLLIIDCLFGICLLCLGARLGEQLSFRSEHGFTKVNIGRPDLNGQPIMEWLADMPLESFQGHPTCGPKIAFKLGSVFSREAIHGVF
jgi:hypothetical protein